MFRDHTHSLFLKKINMIYTREQIKETVENLGYKYFTGDNHDINIIGIRNSRTKGKVTNKFDDLITISYKNEWSGCGMESPLLFGQSTTTHQGHAQTPGYNPYITFLPLAEVWYNYTGTKPVTNAPDNPYDVVSSSFSGNGLNLGTNIFGADLGVVPLKNII